MAPIFFLLSGENLNAAVENALDEEEAKKVYHDDGYMEGKAAQKVEDEKIIQEKDAEIARLKSLLENQVAETKIGKAVTMVS